MIRVAEIKRKTAETDIYLKIRLDGKGESKIETGCGFLDHMLTLFSKHSRFDIEVSCKGDTNVDYHHSVEDIGICLGIAFNDAIGDKRGINRYGDITLPMDEALILAAIDISGRDYLGFDLNIPTEKVGDFDTELVEEFWLGFVRNAKINLHIKQLAGTNSHHIIEGAFKAVGRALGQATKKAPALLNEIPSTKGLL
ncbi:MAG: imidazoleglycerol-phosphate dehydratase HisB [Clostridia bacterium]|nr:imidazoleglycerol-phosphate dehydratase HisB [Clostridia bacterium]